MANKPITLVRTDSELTFWWVNDFTLDSLTLGLQRLPLGESTWLYTGSRLWKFTKISYDGARPNQPAEHRIRATSVRFK